MVKKEIKAKAKVKSTTKAKAKAPRTTEAQAMVKGVTKPAVKKEAKAQLEIREIKAKASPKIAHRKQAEAPVTRVQTYEGWRREMMKKYGKKRIVLRNVVSKKK